MVSLARLNQDYLIMRALPLILFVLFSCFFTKSYACSGGTSAGVLVPNSFYQTQNVVNGQYYAVNVSCGLTYNFTFCSNGGSATWDTQITLNQSDNTTQLAYNDDACGLQSNVSWTATFSGTIHVLISRFNCDNAGGNNAVLAYNVTSPVSYSATCTSANATFSGISSPSFAFNPAPTDGASINSSNGNITNATPGTSYAVQVTHSCGTINLTVTMGTAPCYKLSGNAQTLVISGENCIQLTAEINNQTGCAWSEDPVDFSSDFVLSLDYYFGNNINGADGNTFTFQPNPTAVCGQNGGQLGAGGIANALSVEFDTYDNDFPAHVYDMSCDHVAIEIDGNLLGPGAPLCGPVCAKSSAGNIDDGGTYLVEIAWNSTSQQLDVYFDGNLRLSCNSDFVNTVFGGQNLVYWGATSATGGLNNQQYFCPSTVTVLPAEMISFSSQCQDEGEVFTWVTASEDRVDHFELEYTINGMIYYPVAKVQAVGTSSQPNEYAVLYKQEGLGQKYFRIKTVDQDGRVETSDLISGKGCTKEKVLFGYSFNEDGLFIQSISHEMSIELISSNGQLLRSVQTEDASNIHFNGLSVSRGIYFLKLKEIRTGKEYIERIYY